MNPSDTPVTDAHTVPLRAIRPPKFQDGTYDMDCKWVPAGVSRQLERQRDELYAIAKKYLNTPELTEWAKRTGKV